MGKCRDFVHNLFLHFKMSLGRSVNINHRCSKWSLLKKNYICLISNYASYHKQMYWNKLCWLSVCKYMSGVKWRKCVSLVNRVLTGQLCVISDPDFNCRVFKLLPELSDGLQQYFSLSFCLGKTGTLAVHMKLKQGDPLHATVARATRRVYSAVTEWVATQS